MNELTQWHGITLQDIQQKWNKSKGVHPAFGRQLCHFASDIDDVLKERNPKFNWSGITLADIDQLWKQSSVVDGRGSSGQKLAYFANLIEGVLRDRNHGK